MKADRSLSEKYASDNSCEIYINNHCLLLQAKECNHPCHLEAYFEEVNIKKKIQNEHAKSNIVSMFDDFVRGRLSKPERLHRRGLSCSPELHRKCFRKRRLLS